MTPSLCARCKALPGPYTVRHDAHCRSCFDFYIRSKCVKRMESYKIRSPTTASATDIPTFLLPLSLGVSSTTLLHLLTSQLRAQRQKVTRTRYRLKILHIDERILDPALPASIHLAAVQERFPDAGEYLAVRLEDVYDFASEVRGLEVGGEGNAEKLRALLRALPSPTSREDMAGVLRTRLIVAVARREGCGAGVLWGDSTTRLADKLMAEAAKGRGAALPWTISDGESPYGLKFYHPLRDVFKKELVTFAMEIAEPPLLPLCAAFSPTPKHSAAAATSGRNITVGELLTQYFEAMELQYPNTVSNVVRMGDKLKPAVVADAGPCRMCGLPVDGGGNVLTLGAAAVEGDGHSDMCYGCMRATHGAAAELSWPV